jgi:hypothetical protein
VTIVAVKDGKFGVPIENLAEDASDELAAFDRAAGWLNSPPSASMSAATARCPTCGSIN